MKIFRRQEALVRTSRRYMSVCWRNPTKTKRVITIMAATLLGNPPLPKLDEFQKNLQRRKGGGVGSR